jgi:hypothetical protein
MKLQPILKRIAFFSIILLQYSPLVAQITFSMTPDSIPVAFNGEEYEGPTVITNLSTTTDTFKWVRTIIQLEPNNICTSQVSDNWLHYAPFTSTFTFVLPPQGENTMIMTVLTNTGEPVCCGIVHLSITVNNNPLNRRTAVFLLDPCITNSDEATPTEIQIFPVPSAGILRIIDAPEESRIRILGLDGTMKVDEKIPGNQMINLQSLPSGTYVAVIENKQGVILKTQEIIRQ